MPALHRPVRRYHIQPSAAFNHLQLPVLIEELERAIEIAHDSAVKSHGQALLELARNASSEVHTYLKFYGD
jgi:hypothetical protein